MGDTLVVKRTFLLLTVFSFISSLVFCEEDYIKKTPSAYTYQSILNTLFLKLDQTTPQTVTHGTPTFSGIAIMETGTVDNVDINRHSHGAGTDESKTSTTQADWQAGTQSNVDTTTSSGDLLLSVSSTDPNCKSLLHMDGANAGTTFTDDTGKVWTPFGTATTSTNQIKFGTTSCKLTDGTSYLTTPDNADFATGTGNFTIEAWVYYTTYVGSGADNSYIYAQATDSNNFIFLRVDAVGGYAPNKIVAGIYMGGVYKVLMSSTNDCGLNGWHHIAFIRNGNNFYITRDGAQEATAASVGLNVTNFTGVAKIGQVGYDVYGRPTGAYYDEFRFSNSARWTSFPFTPPTLAYTFNIYNTPGTDTIDYDSGVAETKWTSLSWTGTTPTNTVIKARARAAETQGALSSASWSSYITTSGAAFTTPLYGRWIEVEWNLSTTDTGYTPTLSAGTATGTLYLSGEPITVLPTLTSNGNVITSGGNGTLSVDTTAYISSIVSDAPLSGAGTSASHLVHSTAAGYVHLPTGGAANQLLKNSGASGTGAWGTVTENSGVLSNVTAISPTTDSTTAVRITKAAGTPTIATWDTSNGYYGIGLTPTVPLDINLAVSPGLRVAATGEPIRMKGQAANNACFLTWYTSGDVRRGYFGFPSGSSSNFTLLNEENGTMSIGTNNAAAITISTGQAIRFNVGYGTGTINSDASGNLTSVSDERLKDIQGDFKAGLPEILQINPILYKWNAKSGLDQDNVYAGFSAQNVMQYIPEAIGQNNNGYYSLTDRPLIAALVNAVKEQQNEINELRAVLKLPPKDYSVTPITDDTRIAKSKPADILVKP